MRIAAQEECGEELEFSENVQKSLRRGILVIPRLFAGKVCCEISTLCNRRIAGWRSGQSSFSLGLILCVEFVCGWALQRLMMHELVTDGIPDKVSFVVPARYETDYIVRTVAYIYENTPIQLIQEVIVVDDLSDVPVESLILQSMSRSGLLGFLNEQQRRTILVVRTAERLGLIRAKIKGADMSRGTHILFLDGHCRVMPGYLEAMLWRIKGNYKRIVVPMIPDVDNSTWRIKSATGVKMMFAWDFSFDWFDYPGDEVPILSGGILLITKRWWVESGGYDEGMLEWGGENIDQSMRVWQCGGEIVVERRAIIGHIFYRPLPPDKTTPWQVVRNQARAAAFWLDDYYEDFLTAVPAVRNIGLGSGVAEQFGRRAAMQCHGFDWFVERFRSVFELRGLVTKQMHNLRHIPSSLCLQVSGGSPRGGPPASLHLRPCTPLSLSQRWGFVANGTRLVNAQVHRCLQWRGIGQNNWWTQLPRLEYCDFTLRDIGQIWTFSGSYPYANGRASGDTTDPRNATVSSQGYVEIGPSSALHESTFDNLRGLRGRFPPLCLTSSHNNESVALVLPCVRSHGVDCIYLSPCRAEQKPRMLDEQAWEWIW